MVITPAIISATTTDNIIKSFFLFIIILLSIIYISQKYLAVNSSCEYFDKIGIILVIGGINENAVLFIKRLTYF